MEFRYILVDPTESYNSKEVCKKLHISLSTLYDLKSTGWIKPTTIGQGDRYCQQELYDFWQRAKGYDISNYAKMKLSMIEYLKKENAST